MRLLSSLLLVSACAAPTAPASHHVESEPVYRVTNGYPDLLRSVDDRKTGHPGGSSNFTTFGLKPGKRRDERAPRPVGADRSEPERAPAASAERPQAVETQQSDGSRAYVIAPGKPPPRWEVRSLVERCERRPTQWARERCMEGE